jgi:hypothetical protein
MDGDRCRFQPAFDAMTRRREPLIQLEFVRLLLEDHHLGAAVHPDASNIASGRVENQVSDKQKPARIEDRLRPTEISSLPFQRVYHFFFFPCFLACPGGYFLLCSLKY